MPKIPVAFRPRAVPLGILAAAARDAAAVALAKRLLARDDAALAALTGVSAPGLLVVLGDAATLPWVDGVVYLGRDPEAPSLLLPTALEPDVPAPLFERAVLARSQGGAPIAVLLDPSMLVSVAGARPIERALLGSFVAVRSEVAS
ncbi:Hypothetical protein A7982_09613 [Minicystis rosea]|nr:Hypothetical protein A7982_09613 [Minicystis rosea]